MRYPKSIWGIFIALLVFHCLVNLWWWQLNQNPVPWDQANHTQLALRLFYCFQAGEPLATCWQISTYYPIVTHLVAAGAFFLTGPSIAVAQALGTVFFGLSLWGMLVFFSEATKRPGLGLLTTILVSLTPAVTDVSRYFMTDLALLAAFFWSLVFLRRSLGFTKLGPTLLFGLFAGIAVMTKWYAVLYLAVPVVWELGVLTHQPRKIWLPAVGNMTLGAVLASLIFAPWYALNWQLLLEQAKVYAGADASQPQALLSWSAIFWYLKLAYEYQLFLWPFLMMIIGLLVFIGTEKNALWKWYVVTFLIGQYVIFTLFGNKAVRYSFHLVVFWQFLNAYLIWWLAQKKQILGWWIGAVLVGFYLFLTINLSFGWPVTKPYEKVIKVPGIGWVKLLSITQYPMVQASPHAWPTDEIVNDLLKLSQGQPWRVLVLVDYAQLNISTMYMELLEKGSPQMYPLSFEGVFGSFQNIPADLGPYLRQYDLLLVTTNEVGPDWHRGVYERSRVQSYILGQTLEFEVVQSYNFPVEDLEPSVVTGTNIGGDRLPRKKTCRSQQCNQILLIRPAPQEN